MTSKRELQREVETLSEQTASTDSGPMIMRLTYFEDDSGDVYNATREDSPHPELTVQPFPESRPESLTIAVPSILPEKYARRTWLFAVTCTRKDRYVADRSEDAPGCVSPCEIWDSMTEAQLREERAHRERNDEQIPAILEPYAPE